jgi:predicted DNA-binding protein
MRTKKGRDRKLKSTGSATPIRASISFPLNTYESLETIAKQMKVSLAWVVREASDRYIAEKGPLVART